MAAEAFCNKVGITNIDLRNLVATIAKRPIAKGNDITFYFDMAAIYHEQYILSQAPMGKEESWVVAIAAILLSFKFFGGDGVAKPGCTEVHTEDLITQKLADLIIYAGVIDLCPMKMTLNIDYTDTKVSEQQHRRLYTVLRRYEFAILDQRNWAMMARDTHQNNGKAVFCAWDEGTSSPNP
jgi:hypothetical protein